MTDAVEMFSLKVKTVDGVDIPMELPRSAKVADVAAKVLEESDDEHANCFVRLIFCGRQLKHSATLESCGVGTDGSDNVVLHAVLTEEGPAPGSNDLKAGSKKAVQKALQAKARADKKAGKGGKAKEQEEEYLPSKLDDLKIGKLLPGIVLGGFWGVFMFAESYPEVLTMMTGPAAVLTAGWLYYYYRY